MYRLKDYKLLSLGLLLMALSLQACQKDSRSMTVQIVEKSTMRPLSGFRVDMHYFDGTGGFLNGSFPLYGSAYTDAEGKVFVDGKEHEPAQLRIYGPEPKQYFDMDNSTGYGQISITKSVIDNPVVEMIPFAWLGLEVDFSIYNGEFDYVSYYYEWNGTGNLSGNQKVLPVRVQGNSIISVMFYGMKDGLQVKGWKNEIYCPGLDTTYLVATYSAD